MRALLTTKNFGDKTYTGFALLLIPLYILPYCILGEDAYINIWDFLDSNVAHMHTIATLGLVGKLDGILPIMDGNVSYLFYSPPIPLGVKEWLYLALPTYWAIVGNIIFVKISAFLGMYLLTRKYLIHDKFVSFLVSVGFTFIPFYVDYGLSSAGVPFFLYAALNLENKRKQTVSLLLIIFFTCNSSLNLVGVFLCLLWSCWILYRWIKDYRFPKWHFTGLCLMSVLYLYSNYSIIKDYFFPSNFVSHRVEFNRVPPYEEAFENSLHLLDGSHPHVGNFYVTPLILLAFAIMLMSYKHYRTISKYVLGGIAVMVLIIAGSFAPHLPIPFFKAFDATRFMFLFPTYCFVFIAKSYSLLIQKENTLANNYHAALLFCIMLFGAVLFFTYKLAIAFVLLALVCYFAVARSNKMYFLCLFFFFITLQSTITSDKELVENLPRLAGVYNQEKPSYKQFYDETLFRKIQKDLHINNDYTCKVVSLGMQPSIAEYNRFYTLDSYMQSYSLDYKHQFHKVIAKEIAKDEYLKDYYEKWGSRCYLFSTELEYQDARIYGKAEGKRIANFEIDTGQLKRMGCQYILSAVEIGNYKDLNLTLVNEYSTQESFFNIRVYRVR